MAHLLLVKGTRVGWKQYLNPFVHVPPLSMPRWSSHHSVDTTLSSCFHLQWYQEWVTNQFSWLSAPISKIKIRNTSFYHHDFSPSSLSVMKPEWSSCLWTSTAPATLPLNPSTNSQTPDHCLITTRPSHSTALDHCTITHGGI